MSEKSLKKRTSTKKKSGKKRGRKPKVKNKVEPKKIETVKVNKLPEFDLEKHPVHDAAKWIEKNIPDFELAYQRKDANKHGRTVLLNIIAHILGYFNIRDDDFKRVVKNHQVVNIN